MIIMNKEKPLPFHHIGMIIICPILNLLLLCYKYIPNKKLAIQDKIITEIDDHIAVFFLTFEAKHLRRRRRRHQQEI